MERATTVDGENELARQFLELPRAFERVEIVDPRGCIVRVVGPHRRTTNASWPALESARVEVLC